MKYTRTQGDELKVMELMVDNFAEEMKVRLRQRYEEGYTGWDDLGLMLKYLKDRTPSHNMVDEANVAMFVHNLADDWSY